MSATFILIYILIYVISITTFVLLVSLSFSFHNQTDVTLTILFNFYSTYTPFGFLLYLPFLSLIGLPPVGVFFLKIIFLINILHVTSILTFIIIFMCFFINMLFYLQIFKSTRVSQLVDYYSLSVFKHKTSPQLNPSVVNKNQYLFSSYGAENFYKYNILYLIHLGVLFTIFFMCFNFDLYLIFLNLIS